MARTLQRDEVTTRSGELERFLTRAIEPTAASRTVNIDRESSSTMHLASKATGYVTVVAEERGELVGLMVGQLDPERSEAFVRWLAVCPTRRRQRIGSLLADRFDDLAGAGRIRGVVDLDDPVAVAFWQRRGWRSLLEPRRRIPMGKQFGT